jgi:hypothetical protein
MATTIVTVDQFAISTVTNANVVGPLNNAVTITAIAHNVASATNHTLTFYRVPAGGTAATNNSFGVATIAFGNVPTVLNFMAGQGLQNASFYVVADATNKVVFNATLAITT